jgi:hypothetical protein
MARGPFALGLLLILGCQGRISEPPGLVGGSGPGPVDPNNPPPPPPPIDPCATRDVPNQPLRRLSAEQYANVISDLFGTQAGPLLTGSLFPPTVITRGFRHDAEANTVNTAQSNAIEDNAERIASTLIASPDVYLRAVWPCTLPANYGDAELDACIDQFIGTFGRRAYRRPLSSNEVTVARGVYDAIRAEQGAINAWASVVQFFAQAPALLYRVERGLGPAPGQPRLIQLDPYELASRLSFFLVGSGPDDTLLDEAAAGRLSTPAQLEAQARRLMASPRYLTTLVEFHSDWLHLYEAARGKDPLVFPEYTAEVVRSLAQEPEAFMRMVLEEEDGSLRALLGSRRTPVDATLANYYGAPTPPTPWAAVEAPNRRGLLTLASVQAALGKTDSSSPIHRGNFIRSSVLCAPQLVLPANVDIATPLAGTSGAPTARERLAPLSSRSDCAGCHQQINPIGFSFENYDGAGRYRATENGATIDASGTVDVGTGPIAFTNATELAGIFADSVQVERCYALQWFRAGLGRTETPEDTCSVATLRDVVRASDGDLESLLLGLIQTDAFLYRRPVEAP